MKRCNLVGGLLLIVPILRCEDFKTIDGKEYKNATVSRVEPDGIVLTGASGISKVYFVELPADVRLHYGFDPAKAAAYATAQAEAQRTTAAQIAAMAAKHAEDNKRAAQQASEEEQANVETAKIRSSELELRITHVVQIKSDGVIMEGMNASDLNGRLILSEDEFFLAGIDSTNMTDRAVLSGSLKVYRAGVYRSGISTIARYATSPELAYRLLQQDKKRRSDE